MALLFPAHIHPLASTYYGMLARCKKPSNTSFKHYGARGISVCQRWEESIDNFIEDMGQRPPGMTLDRINSDGNYEPTNCRWATSIEQAINRRTVRIVEIKGERDSLSGWAKRFGIHPAVVHQRVVNMGMDPIVALTMPRDRGATKRYLKSIKQIA